MKWFNNNQRLLEIIALVCVFGYGLVLRGSALRMPHPFWVDEFSSAVQARLWLDKGIGVFGDMSVSFEPNNLVSTLLVATSFLFFGESPVTARLPFVILGAMVPIALYFFAKKYLDRSTAWVAALLSLCSVFMVTWSVQARGYTLQQLCLLLVLSAYLQLISTSSKKAFYTQAVWWIGAVLFSLLVHVFFWVVLAAQVLHLLCMKRQQLFEFIRGSWWMLLVLGGVVVGVLSVSGFFETLWAALTNGRVGLHQNLWYYHSFLWREHTVVTLLAACGVVPLWRKDTTLASLALFVVGLHSVLIGFVLEMYVTRYVLLIFPLLLLFAAQGITFITHSLFTSVQIPKTKLRLSSLALAVVFTGVLIANGHTFVWKPKAFYSVNYFMREIALLDYDTLYNLIENKGKLEEGKTLIIESWPDRARWYLGTYYQPLGVLHWQNAVLDAIPYSVEKGVKVLPNSSGARLITEVSDLERAMAEYPRGFIWIDDTAFPADVRAFAEKELTKELYLDHYAWDDNPYSIWPGTLYSWGVE